MKQHFITVNDLQIAYYEKHPGNEKAIIFIHGNSCSSRMWQKQFESEKLNQYLLMAIDLPGHGKSSASKKPFEDYSPINTAAIIATVIKQLIAKKDFILVGFSYGSNLVAEMLLHDLHPEGIVITGSSVFGENIGLDKIFMPSEKTSIFLYNEPNEKAVNDFLAEQIHTDNKQYLTNSIADYLGVTPDFKPALFKAAGEGKVTDEIKTLSNSKIPVCVIFGAEDKLVNINYLDSMPFTVWRSQIYKIPGAGHWVNIDAADIFNQTILEYATERLQ
jgi:pimeloyl-ACP methyl ester carboxylesterase